MCLAALAIDQHRRFPLVLAANRDEFFDRPAARLSWWTPAPGAPEILAGRDLHAGGTWLGLTAAGRLALLTNVRRPDRMDPHAPSRGAIVPLWLQGTMSPDRFWVRVAVSGHNPFNLIAADFRSGDCWWIGADQASPQRLGRGLFGLSNAALDTPWPKVQALKTRVAASIGAAETVDALSQRLFTALADRTPAPDAMLPATGIAHERERQLSSAFIRTDDQRYGTRCSTVIITERVNKRLVTHVLERSFPTGGGVALLRRARLRDWPPRYSEVDLTTAALDPVSESELVDEAEPAKRTRVRSLLKPEPVRRR
jgi:uncharacterized protein with NRDE domain